MIWAFKDILWNLLFFFQDKDLRVEFLKKNVNGILESRKYIINYHYFAVFLAMILTIFQGPWKNTDKNIYLYIWSRYQYLDVQSKKEVNGYIYDAIK
jgi:hypothetical protein